MSDQPNHPYSRAAAQALGCTCHWYGTGSIISFGRDCPILDQHRIPASGRNWIADAQHDHNRQVFGEGPANPLPRTPWWRRIPRYRLRIERR